ncbi:hypothetical protein HD597_004948 [Nonomuraea thailandensis]|uniref:Uncharacterized protein n=1 Tax=Nonomuraea thailandensis TaxID=1188745 RepID=A0A9X2GP72_9ACTN|nr:hypothetical protein [Nonomuraea thailandensis]
MSAAQARPGPPPGVIGEQAGQVAGSLPAA